MHELQKEIGTIDAPLPVLLVEDNLVNQKITLLLLEKLGLAAKVANNGKAAVEAVGQDKFSVILMDCHMPEMDGFQATVSIRKLEGMSGTYTPIIAVTALAMSGDRERCLAAGMDDYISKPIDRELLRIKLNHWLTKEVVFHQHNIHKYMRGECTFSVLEKDPISFKDLVEFYGEEQTEQILRIFFESAKDILRRISFFLGRQDGKALAGLAHELKASCAGVGAKKLAKLSLTLEQAAGQNDWTEVEETVESMTQVFDYCQQYILAASGAKMPVSGTESMINR